MKIATTAASALVATAAALTITATSPAASAHTARPAASHSASKPAAHHKKHVAAKTTGRAAKDRGPIPRCPQNIGLRAKDVRR